MSIYMTGDLHGEPRRLSSDVFTEQKTMTRDDVVAVLGDFGLVFQPEETELEKLFLDWLEGKNFTLIATLGNHENYDRIAKLPVEERFGAPVYVLRENIFLLQSGYIYTINGKTIFNFNGAASHDISDGLLDGNDPDWLEQAMKLQEEGKHLFRVKGVSWWPQEVESDDAVYQRGINALEAVNYNVDFIFTHCASTRLEEKLGFHEHSRLSDYFDDIEQRLPARTIWLFGHYHINAVADERRFCLYEQIVEIA